MARDETRKRDGRAGDGGIVHLYLTVLYKHDACIRPCVHWRDHKTRQAGEMVQWLRVCTTPVDDLG